MGTFGTEHAPFAGVMQFWVLFTITSAWATGWPELAITTYAEIVPNF
jgi:hypothetical protein